MSIKSRLTEVEKDLYAINESTKVYKRQAEALRQIKDAFEKAFDAKNADIRRKICNEVDHIREELKRNLEHHRSQNGRIKQQLEQLNLEKESFQAFLRNIREKLEAVERQVGE